MVVAKPFALGIERHGEDPGLGQGPHHRLTGERTSIAILANPLAKRPREAIQHRSLQEALPQLRRLLGEDFREQVVADVLEATLEVKEELLGLGPVPCRQRHQM